MDVDGRSRFPFDLTVIVTRCERMGAVVVLLDCALREARSATRTRLEEWAWARGDLERRKLHKLIDRAQSRIDSAVQGMEPREGACTAREIRDLKTFFAQHARELGEDARGQVKNPIPEDGDLEIMIRTRSLEGTGSKYLLSKDKHFTRYAEEIRAQCGAIVLHVGYWGRACNELGIY